MGPTYYDKFLYIKKSRGNCVFVFVWGRVNPQHFITWRGGGSLGFRRLTCYILRLNLFWHSISQGITGNGLILTTGIEQTHFLSNCTRATSYYIRGRYWSPQIIDIISHKIVESQKYGLQYTTCLYPSRMASNRGKKTNKQKQKRNLNRSMKHDTGQISRKKNLLLRIYGWMQHWVRKKIRCLNPYTSIYSHRTST